MFTGASRRRRPRSHARRSRNAAREGLRFRGDARSWNGRGDRNVAREGALSGRREVMRRARRRECCARGRVLSPCAARPDKGRANPAHGVRRGLHRRHATRRCGIYLGISRHRARMDIFHLSPNGTRRGLSRRGFPGGFPGGLFRGLSRGLGARKCDVYPKHGPSTAGRTFSVCHRTGRGEGIIKVYATRKCGIYPGTARQRAR